MPSNHEDGNNRDSGECIKQTADVLTSWRLSIFRSGLRRDAHVSQQPIRTDGESFTYLVSQNTEPLLERSLFLYQDFCWQRSESRQLCWRVSPSFPVLALSPNTQLLLGAAPPCLPPSTLPLLPLSVVTATLQLVWPLVSGEIFEGLW